MGAMTESERSRIAVLVGIIYGANRSLDYAGEAPVDEALEGMADAASELVGTIDGIIGAMHGRGDGE